MHVSVDESDADAMKCSTLDGENDPPFEFSEIPKPAEPNNKIQQLQTRNAQLETEL